MFLFATDRSMRGSISSWEHLAEEAKVVVSQTPAIVVVAPPLVWCVRAEVETGAKVFPGVALKRKIVVEKKERKKKEKEKMFINGKRKKNWKVNEKKKKSQNRIKA